MVARRILIAIAVAMVTVLIPLRSDAAVPTVTATLDKTTYAPGETINLTVVEDLVGARTFVISDTGGHTWTKVLPDDGTTTFWRTTAKSTTGNFTVTATMTRTSDGAKFTGTDTFGVHVPAPTLSLSLDASQYDPNDPITANVVLSPVSPGITTLSDTDGRVYTLQSYSAGAYVFTATAGPDEAASPITVTASYTRNADPVTVTATDTYTVTAPVVEPPADDILWGMSAPMDQWAARAAEVGPGLEARRVFVNDMSVADVRTKVEAALDDGLVPVLSVKPGDWGDVLAGQKDAQIDAIATAIASYDTLIYATAHHEPGDLNRATLQGEQGTLPEWAEMVGYFGDRVRAIAPKVKVGPIDNGFKFSTNRGANQGMTDAQLDAIYPNSVLAKYDFLASDTYHAGTTADPGANAVVKIVGMGNFATRRGFNKPLGVGEYNGLFAPDITDAQDAIIDDGRFAFACIFNSNENNRDGVSWQLSGARLAAFQAVLD